MRGYRGWLRGLARTGSRRALALQLRVGALHWLRRLGRSRGAEDAEALFLRNYADDGLRRSDPQRAALQLGAEACLVCGLCSAECARAGGRPRLDPRDAVLSAARLEVDVLRLALRDVAGPCASCRACEGVCPAQIPIADVQHALGSLGADAG